ncbi:craniofacial development protein 1 isoform X2 [Phycodurus eques]|uniref:craniofacial development protein 1 isoform X2 n=1 Tax=Phycodurus eques TaxID=693459 RepID=UPI002ACE8CCE|nr:craniofacial development protein 1 isoform X2 [Phycodurus eques]
MNYSDDDSDGYSSSEDADYAPSDDNVSEDDINECEKEEPSDENDGVPHPDNVTKTKRSVKKNGSSLRKSPKRVLKVDGEEKNGGGTEEARPLQEDVEKLTQIQKDDEATQKKQSDDLWARFLSDVAPRPKGSMAASPTHTTPEAHSLASSVCMRTESQESDPAKVTIVKVFDFAGEEIRVNKEVLADSKEAKIHLESQCTKEKMGEKRNTSPSQSTCPGPRTSTASKKTKSCSRHGAAAKKTRVSAVPSGQQGCPVY